MLGQPSKRFQRSKCFRAKHSLRIMVLVAICIWLIYQAKYSQLLNSSTLGETKLTSKVHSQLESTSFGRKVLPQNTETDTGHETLHKEKIKGEKETVEEEEEETEVARQGETETDGFSDEGREAEVIELGDDQESYADTREAAREENYKGDDVASGVNVGVDSLDLESFEDVMPEKESGEEVEDE